MSAIGGVQHAKHACIHRRRTARQGETCCLMSMLTILSYQINHVQNAGGNPDPALLCVIFPCLSVQMSDANIQYVNGDRLQAAS